ncbi:hypothetical protein P8452_00267 [Trifolium repens]|nr:hypothetical protein P8452_00267 [Trifolium repens]
MCYTRRYFKRTLFLQDSNLAIVFIGKIAILEEKSSLEISSGIAHEVADDSRGRLRNMAAIAKRIIQKCIFQREENGIK